jgi:hypothetical protein
MKNSAWYNMLWKNKLQEFPLEGDADMSWQKMQSLLDKNLPANYSATPKPTKLLGLKLVKLLAVITSAALVYYGLTQLISVSNKNNKKPGRHIIQVDSNKQNEPKKDSTNNTRPDNKNANNKANTISLDKTTIYTNTVVTNSITGDNSSDNKTTSKATNIKSVNNSITEGNNLSARKITSKVTNRSSGNHTVSLSNKANRLNTAPGHVTGKSATSFGNGNIFNSRNSNYISKKGSNRKHLRNTRQNKGYKTHTHLADTLNLIVNNGKPVSDTDTSNNLVTSQNSNNGSITGETKKTNTTNAIKKDSTLTLSTNKPPGTTQQGANATAKGKSNTKDKTNRFKNNTTNSKFTLGIIAGVNISGIPGGGTSPIFGMTSSYSLTPKVSVAIGANLLQKTISGTYTNSNYKYTTIIDTNKQVTHTADKIMVSSSRKIYTIDIPLFVSYQASNWISLIGGPVINIPTHLEKIKNVLNPISNPVDTSSAYKTILSVASSTTISNKINFSVFGGVKLDFKRLFIEGDYLWGINPNTVSSSLGKNKVYYRSYQFGVGYYLFKPKP